ncbi:hypothetical protein N7448_000866 [Penicillium atrosanguineum]|uniref:Uncharacterized protein n=1 Tax=Penicillium atrosanguineum TaxID=1132637 RepID=A0A9W9HJ38_9EURO|nr:uncharacterized protein N7443_004261 [Penicillium atrosanguineum]KAJ5134113.1 hypothetical protein N7526_005478 [Penicillium atrosanguineum]KAJ5149288.1 hypothetical protein N7448_000866 [Penicillium atrosanguineum]KAJ5304601.1 hypothetical protein N7443_004261 [Penicillium atrosanguineum]KAJ5324069.1 hypothetical protein N7476_002669 [Penicillium atrosanguineum]
MARCESQFYTISPSRFRHGQRTDIESKRTYSLASSTTSLSSQPTKLSPFLRLPTEVRLEIYKWALSVLHDEMGRPLIVVGDSSNSSTRPRFHSMSICSSWTGEDGTARKLLAVNHQIHDEAEDFLYSQNTLFFRNSFNLDRLGEFLDTLSNSARSHIRSVGFEVFIFVHAESGVPKRTFKQYEKAGILLRARLPQWEKVLFDIDPYFYYPPNSVGGRDSATRGVVDLAARFRALCKEVVFTA